MCGTETRHLVQLAASIQPLRNGNFVGRGQKSSPAREYVWDLSPVIEPPDMPEMKEPDTDTGVQIESATPVPVAMEEDSAGAVCFLGPWSEGGAMNMNAGSHVLFIQTRQWLQV